MDDFKNDLVRRNTNHLVLPFLGFLFLGIFAVFGNTSSDVTSKQVFFQEAVLPTKIKLKHKIGFERHLPKLKNVTRKHLHSLTNSKHMIKQRRRSL